MKKEFREVIRLSPELEDKTFDMQGLAFELLEEEKNDEAEATIWDAWNLLPEPKFNTSCSHTILCDLVKILITNKKHEEAKAILEAWINDLENCGYKVTETEPYIFLGENYLHLNDIDRAKEQFYKTIKYGATKRDFSGKPNLYFDIAKKKITGNDEIEKLFAKEILNQPKQKETIEELSDEVCDQIEELCENGNEHFDDEKYDDAIKIWKEALSLIPNPQNSHSESLWLETSIGDAYFMLRDYNKSLEYFQNAKSNTEENAYENPFIMLRLGQNLLENNKNEEAKEYLLRAYMFESEEIFENEDSKYFDFLKQNVELK